MPHLAVLFGNRRTSVKWQRGLDQKMQCCVYSNVQRLGDIQLYEPEWPRPYIVYGSCLSWLVSNYVLSVVKYFNVIFKVKFSSYCYKLTVLTGDRSWVWLRAGNLPSVSLGLHIGRTGMLRLPCPLQRATVMIKLSEWMQKFSANCERLCTGKEWWQKKTSNDHNSGGGEGQGDGDNNE